MLFILDQIFFVVKNLITMLYLSACNLWSFDVVICDLLMIFLFFLTIDVRSKNGVLKSCESIT